MQYINLTGLDIRLVTPSGEIKLDLPAGSHQARVDAVHGIHLVETSSGKIIPGFPWKKEHHNYVVLAPLTQTLHRRSDIVALGDIIMDQGGAILGHSSFVGRG